MIEQLDAQPLHGVESGLGPWVAFGGRLGNGTMVEFVYYAQAPGPPGFNLRVETNAEYAYTLDRVLRMLHLERSELPWISERVTLADQGTQTMQPGRNANEVLRLLAASLVIALIATLISLLVFSDALPLGATERPGRWEALSVLFDPVMLRVFVAPQFVFIACIVFVSMLVARFLLRR